tara:strand:- start:60 stop:401 length:342 start_codon:yes stop_codon:yes gene_type:complete
MTELEKIKQELTSLTERVNNVITLTDGSICLTHEQVRKLIVAVQKELIKSIEYVIDNTCLNIEDNIELELNGHEIEINVNEDDIKDNIKQEIINVDWTSDDDIKSLMFQYLDQ